MTFNLSFEQINAALLDNLRAEGVREGRQLDYKETLPGASDDQKREFLSDVTSFANAAGGDLIFGVRERREDGNPTGEIDAILGLPELNVDSERLRLEALIRDGVAPRMLPINFHEIRRDPEPPCLLIRIPRSSSGLHMVTYRNLSRFFSRTSAGKYQLDVHEIQAGFVAAEAAFERLRRFRLERVTRAIALDGPALVGDGPKLILHGMPIAVLEEVWPRIIQIEDHRLASVASIGGSRTNWRFNLDGFVAHTQRSVLSQQCYTQLFRDGGIEVLSGNTLARVEERGGFYAWGMEQQVIDALSGCQQFWRDIGLVPPLLIGLSLSGVKNWKVLREAYGWNDTDARIDRDLVLPPEVILSDLTEPADVVLRPLFDFIWNGGGWPGSPNYRSGRWFPPSQGSN